MLSDIYIKGTGRVKPEKDWGYYGKATYEEGGSASTIRQQYLRSQG
jgi:hypothetical protein